MRRGCFPINGVCVPGGGDSLPTGTDGQTLSYVGTTLTATSTLTVLANGNVGIGTTSPYAKLSVVGEVVGAYFTATTTTATSTFAGGLSAPSSL